jgi:hypothetical protein
MGAQDRVPHREVDTITETWALVDRTKSPMLEVLDTLIGMVSSSEMANRRMREDLGLELQRLQAVRVCDCRSSLLAPWS